MKKLFIPLMAVPFFLFGCGKNKDVYAKSKNTIFEFKLEGDNAVITGLNGNYKNQTEIIIPYSIDKHIVTRIDNYSFDENYRLKNIDMSKSKLTEIGASAFRKCSNLVKIEYPNTITSIEHNAFEMCESLVEMDLTNCSLTLISDELFSKCSSLTNVIFPQTTKIIGSNVFTGCDSITEIDYKNLQIEELKDYAFYNLSNLKDVTLSDTTKIIGAYAFAEDKKIQFLNFTNTSLEEVKEGAFSNCKLLANISFPQTLEKLGKKSLYYCSKLSKIDLSKTKIESIPESCFELCRVFDNIKLPAIKEIASRAFYNSSLRLIDIPKSTTTIADDAFRLCNKLEEITVDYNNTNFIVHNDALYTYDKTKLLVYPAACSRTEFSISSETTTINPYAFAEAVNLTKIDLTAANISEIGGYTFMNCSSLKTFLTFDNGTIGVKKIGVKAFFGCKALTSFDGGTSILEIGESAFYDCINLTSVNLIECTSLTKIDAEAFYNCNKLDTLTLPGSIDVVGRAAFYGCNDITTFTFGANRTIFEGILQRSPDCGLEQYKDRV